MPRATEEERKALRLEMRRLREEREKTSRALSAHLVNRSREQAEERRRARESAALVQQASEARSVVSFTYPEGGCTLDLAERIAVPASGYEKRARKKG